MKMLDLSAEKIVVFLIGGDADQDCKYEVYTHFPQILGVVIVLYLKIYLTLFCLFF